MYRMCLFKTDISREPLLKDLKDLLGALDRAVDKQTLDATPGEVTCAYKEEGNTSFEVKAEIGDDIDSGQNPVVLTFTEESVVRCFQSLITEGYDIGWYEGKDYVWTVLIYSPDLILSPDKE